MADFVPRDRLLQKAYCSTLKLPNILTARRDSWGNSGCLWGLFIKFVSLNVGPLLYEHVLVIETSCINNCGIPFLEVSNEYTQNFFWASLKLSFGQ